MMELIRKFGLELFMLTQTKKLLLITGLQMMEDYTTTKDFVCSGKYRGWADFGR